MSKFSQQSLTKLESCDPKLQSLFAEVIKHWDCAILSGHRTQTEQEQLVKEGKSQTMNSKHLLSPSQAVDVAPYPIDWSDTQRFYYFAGFVLGIAESMGLNIRWGGDWNDNMQVKDNNFNDLVHYEIK